MNKIWTLLLSVAILGALTQCKTLQITCETVEIEICDSGFRQKLVGQNFESFVCTDSDLSCRMPYQATYEINQCSFDGHGDNCTQGLCFTASSMSSCSNTYNCSVGPYPVTYECVDCGANNSCQFESQKCKTMSILGQQSEEISCLGAQCSSVGRTSGVIDECSIPMFGQLCGCCLTDATMDQSICITLHPVIGNQQVYQWVMDKGRDDNNTVEELVELKVTVLGALIILFLVSVLI